MKKQLLAFLIFAFTSSAAFSQVYWEQMGTNIYGDEDGDGFGNATSISADGFTFAAGARGHDCNRGHVKIFTWDESSKSWNQKGGDIDGANCTDQSGESVSLSDDGNIVAIGAPLNDVTFDAAGHVRIFEWDGTAWIQKGSDIGGKSQLEYSGEAVGLSGDGLTVAIGSPDDGGSTMEGYVRIYRWDGIAWSQLGTDLIGEVDNDHFGYSISLTQDGNTVAIGAPESDNGSWSGDGHVKVYDWDGSNWTQRGNKVSGQFHGDSFGYSVDITPDGNTFIASAPDNKENEGREGRIRVFTWNGSDWIEKGDNGVQGIQYWEVFGYGVSISDDANRIAASATGYDDVDIRGRVEILGWDGVNNWQVIGENIYGDGSNGGGSGAPVHLSSNGSIILITAISSIASPAPGHTRVYRLCGENPPVADVADLPDIMAECELTTLTAPTATDDCFHTVTATHNASLPINTLGTTVVTWTYTDAAGNTITQEQNVIISCPVGVTENALKEISVFPNPTHDVVNISSFDSPINIRLTSLSGQVLFSKDHVASDYQLDLSSLAKGLYILSLSNKDGKVIHKIIKE